MLLKNALPWKPQHNVWYFREWCSFFYLHKWADWSFGTCAFQTVWILPPYGIGCAAFWEVSSKPFFPLINKLHRAIQAFGEWLFNKVTLQKVVKLRPSLSLFKSVMRVYWVQHTKRILIQWGRITLKISISEKTHKIMEEKNPSQSYKHFLKRHSEKFLNKMYKCSLRTLMVGQPEHQPVSDKISALFLAWPEKFRISPLIIYHEVLISDLRQCFLKKKKKKKKKVF